MKKFLLEYRVIIAYMLGTAVGLYAGFHHADPAEGVKYYGFIVVCCLAGAFIGFLDR